MAVQMPRQMPKLAASAAVRFSLDRVQAMRAAHRDRAPCYASLSLTGFGWNVALVHQSSDQWKVEDDTQY